MLSLFPSHTSAMLGNIIAAKLIGYTIHVSPESLRLSKGLDINGDKKPDYVYYATREPILERGEDKEILVFVVAVSDGKKYRFFSYQEKYSEMGSQRFAMPYQCLIKDNLLVLTLYNDVKSKMVATIIEFSVNKNFVFVPVEYKEMTSAKINAEGTLRSIKLKSNTKKIEGTIYFNGLPRFSSLGST